MILFRFDGTIVVTIGTSTYNHECTALGNYNGKALVTGCWYDDTGCERKTELMEMDTLQWSDGPDYPFTEDSNGLDISG